MTTKTDITLPPLPGALVDVETEARAYARAAVEAALQGRPTIAWLTRTEDGDPAMLFFDRAEAETYCADGTEPESLVLGADQFRGATKMMPSNDEIEKMATKAGVWVPMGSGPEKERSLQALRSLITTALSRYSSGQPAASAEPSRCEDCPPVGYPTDKTRCAPCDRRAAPVAQEPVARVNDEGFIVETGIPLAPGTKLYAAPVAPQAQPIQWPTMPSRKGQSPVLFDDGYAEGWAKCMSECQKAVAAQAQPQNERQNIHEIIPGQPSAQDREDAHDIDAAAKTLAECMDYPWEPMPEKGREAMRKHAKRVIDASLKLDMQRESQRGAESAQGREDAAVLTSEFSKGYEIGLRQRTSQDREDAERYRWLREQRDGGGPAAAVRCLSGPYFNNPVYGDRLDAAIDAARAAKGE